MGIPLKKFTAPRGLRLPGRSAWLLLLAFGALLIPATADAVTTISQGFSTTDQVRIGSIVSLKSNTSDQVVAANGSNVDNTLGVVIDNGNTLLTLTSSQSNQVQVATSGIVEALVSNINGDINQNDEITA